MKVTEIRTWTPVGMKPKWPPPTALRLHSRSLPGFEFQWLMMPTDIRSIFKREPEWLNSHLIGWEGKQLSTLPQQQVCPTQPDEGARSDTVLTMSIMCCFMPPVLTLHVFLKSLMLNGNRLWSSDCRLHLPLLLLFMCFGDFAVFWIRFQMNIWSFVGDSRVKWSMSRTRGTPLIQWKVEWYVDH